MSAQHIQAFRPFLEKVQSLRVNDQRIGEVSQCLLVVPILAVNYGFDEVVLRDIILRFVNGLQDQVQLGLLTGGQKHCRIKIEQRVVGIYLLARTELFDGFFRQVCSGAAAVVLLHVVYGLVEVGLDPVGHVLLGLLQLGTGLAVFLVLVLDDALAEQFVVHQ